MYRTSPPLDILDEYHPSLVTTLYDDQGKPFATFYEQRRILVPLAKIPRILQEALIAVEDSRFYQHYGLDPVGITRALWTNLKCFCLAEGGSTITQQLAKVLFFNPEKSLSRKLREALLVLKIEREYTKDQILVLYFNQIYFGHGAYGIEAAAQTYFKKPVGDLNLAEAAMLAGLPRAPNAYSPNFDPERARRRRHHVLQRMAQEGFITPEQVEAATTLPFHTAPYAQAKDVAAHFVEHVRQDLEKKYGTYAVYHQGAQSLHDAQPQDAGGGRSGPQAWAPRPWKGEGSASRHDTSGRRLAHPATTRRRRDRGGHGDGCDTHSPSRTGG